MLKNRLEKSVSFKTLKKGLLQKKLMFLLKKILNKDLKKKVIVESQTSTMGVMYADYFTVTTKFCLTKATQNSCRLVISNFINYKKQPNFIAKSKTLKYTRF